MSHVKNLFPLNNTLQLHHRLNSVRCMATGYGGGRANRRQEEKTDNEETEGEFRVYEIEGLARQKDREPRKFREKSEIPVLPPRSKTMLPNQDWTKVWPTAASFNWQTIPFPVRQGYIEKSENKGMIPGRYGNAELRKIPNFLHLTPVHIKKHCEALKQLCTTWPTVLDNDKKCDKVFPVSVKTRDYCFSGNRKKDERARVVTIQTKLSDLKLDDHGNDKIKRLLGDRYNPADDTITLETNRCPLRKQNYDYAMYLLTACYFEACKTEPWELEKEKDDYATYQWDLSQSKHNTIDYLHKVHMVEKGENILQTDSTHPDDSFTEKCVTSQEVVNYAEAVTELHDEGENINTINNYKDSVLKLLNIQCEVK